MLTIRVDNRYLVDVGVNAHSISDHTQGTWNGIAGDISLEAGSPVFIKQVQVFPDVKAKTATVKIPAGAYYFTGARRKADPACAIAR